MHTFKIKVTESLLNKVYSKHLFRRSWLYATSFSIISIGIVMDYRLHPGKLSIISTAGLITMVFIFLSYVSAYFKQRRAVKKICKRIGNNETEYRLTANFIGAESPLGKMELKWSSLQKLAVTNEHTLVYWGESAFLTLPTTQIPDTALDFLIGQFKENNLSIEDHRRRS